MNNKEYGTATDIYRFYRSIIRNQFLKDYTVIITGKTGPTGKTTLCKLLNNAGINAIDISESLNSYVNYSNDNRNYKTIDKDNKIVLVVLNRLK